MYAHWTRKNFGTAMCFIATAALASSVTALPAEASASASSVTRSKSTTVVASATAGIAHSHPECNEEFFTSLTVTQQRPTGTNWHVQLRGSDYYDCRSGGAEDTVIVDEDLQPGEFEISRDLGRARLDADVTFRIFWYPDEPFSAPGQLTVEWTAKGARTVERLMVRTRTGWTRTTVIERASNVPSLLATQSLPGVWGDLHGEAQTTAFLRATMIKALQR